VRRRLDFISFLADARGAGQTRAVSARRIRRPEYVGGAGSFVQPQRTLILAVWADGEVASRVDEKGNPPNLAEEGDYERGV
jgi:hypothetical protein